MISLLRGVIRLKQKIVLSKNEIQQLIDASGSIDLQLIILIMSNTGMRVGELVNFKIKWINFEDLTIRVQSNKKPIGWTPKRDSERLIPISEGLAANIKRYIQNRKKGYVFQSNKKHSKDNNRTFGRYEYRSIIKKINEVSKRIFKTNIGSHIFRASYASHLLRAGMDLESLRKLLGHSDIKTTLIYCRSLPDFKSFEKVRTIELMDLKI